MIYTNSIGALRKNISFIALFACLATTFALLAASEFMAKVRIFPFRFPSSFVNSHPLRSPTSPRLVAPLVSSPRSSRTTVPSPSSSSQKRASSHCPSATSRRGIRSLFRIVCGWAVTRWSPPPQSLISFLSLWLSYHFPSSIFFGHSRSLCLWEQLLCLFLFRIPKVNTYLQLAPHAHTPCVPFIVHTVCAIWFVKWHWQITIGVKTIFMAVPSAS